MANYKNSLGESELFGRMTAGFAKICESVQSGKFVRDEMGVICESVCEDNEESYPDHIDITPEEYADLEGEIKDYAVVCRGGKPAWRNEAEWFNLVYGFILWWIAKKVRGSDRTTSLAAPKCEHTRINILDGNGKRVCAFEPIELAKKEVGLDYVESLVSPPDEIRLEDVNDDGATADAGTTDAGTEGATQDADVASATPEQINGSVNEGEKLTKGAVDFIWKPGSFNMLTNSGENGPEDDGWVVADSEFADTHTEFGTLDDVVREAIKKGISFDVDADLLPKFRKWYDALEEAKVVGEGIVGKTLGTIGGATVGSAIGGALGCPVAGGIAGGIAGASLTEGCDGKNKKPMKKLIPEGCCGGKAKKVLKECGSTVVTEKKVPLCKTCGNPLDETGTCQDCQGYSPVKEGEGEIKLQIPAELKRKAALKANAQANKEKVAQAIRDGKAVGIVKEGLDDRKGADKITKDVVFGMLVNLLYQLRDGASVEEVTANPDMEEFDDYTLDEVLELAKKYDGKSLNESGRAFYIIAHDDKGYYVKDVHDNVKIGPSFPSREHAERYLEGMCSAI